MSHAVGIGQINERARLVLGDCLDPVAGLASLPDQSVDAAIFDPPFTAHVHENIVTTGRAKGFKSVDLGFAAITQQQIEDISDHLGGGKSSVYTVPVEQRDREHPTQKPLALMRALVEDFTDPSDLILDPFAGSGTTGVAALTLGRRFIGWEMDAKHHATAARRIGETREQPSLLGPRGPKAKQQGLGL